MTGFEAPRQRPLVAIYRGVMMNYNEVYLRTEVEALKRYRSFYVGSYRVAEVDLPSERTLTLREEHQRTDRVLDPLVKRIGWRLERLRPFARLGHTLARGAVVGNASAYAFQMYGFSPVLTRRLRSLKPAIMHAYTGVSAAHALPLARRLGIPLVATFGGYDATATDAELGLWITRGRVLLRRREEMKRELRLVITVSQFLRDRLVERGWPADRVVVLSRGIDTDLFTPEGTPSQSLRAPVVLFAGRLIEVKGVAYLIQAMHEVQKQIVGAELRIAGSGALRQSLEKMAEDLGVRVRFMGRATPKMIRACHAEAQLFCLPSVSASTGQREGMSNALLEAMSSALPVVASRSGGIPEAVGETGVLVPERSPEDLAAAIVALMKDAALRENLGAAARQRILQHFDLRRQAAQLERLYDGVLSDYSATPAPSS